MIPSLLEIPDRFSCERRSQFQRRTRAAVRINGAGVLFFCDMLNYDSDIRMYVESSEIHVNTVFIPFYSDRKTSRENLARSTFYNRTFKRLFL